MSAIAPAIALVVATRTMRIAVVIAPPVAVLATVGMLAAYKVEVSFSITKPHPPTQF